MLMRCDKLKKKKKNTHRKDKNTKAEEVKTIRL